MKTHSISLLNRCKRAFTLIEIMVATVIMVVLVGLVVQITGEVLKVWNTSSGKLAANAEARIALDLLTQDLETAVFRNNGQRWLEAKQEDFTNPLSGSSFKTTQLKLFSPALDRPAGPGDICAISYLLDYRNPIDGTDSGAGDRTFILYRNVIAPQETFDDMMGAGNQEDFNNAEWNELSTVGAQGGNYLVSNVVDFRIDFHVEDDGDVATDTLVTGDVLFGGTGQTVGGGAPQPKFAKPLAYADLTLIVISDEALQVVQNNVLAQTGYANWDEYITANGEVFTRRINFLARPL